MASLVSTRRRSTCARSPNKRLQWAPRRWRSAAPLKRSVRRLSFRVKVL